MKSIALVLMFVMVGCASFKAERVDSKRSDEEGLEITDNWMAEDTRQAVNQTIEQLRTHPSFKRFLQNKRGAPKLFVAEVQNNTAEAYFPIDDMNDELLFNLSRSGDYVLVDAKARESLLKEITYQNDGMVDPSTAKSIGKQIGADLMIFGSVYMKPESRSGKTIKEYSVNLRMTDVQRGVEVVRTRVRVNKFSDKKSYSW